jgi:hypothetical protein
MQHRTGGEHLGIEQRPPRQEPMQIAAMPVGPFHHRRNAKAPLAEFFRLYSFSHSNLSILSLSERFIAFRSVLKGP